MFFQNQESQVLELILEYYTAMNYGFSLVITYLKINLQNQTLHFELGIIHHLKKYLQIKKILILMPIIQTGFILKQMDFIQLIRHFKKYHIVFVFLHLKEFDTQYLPL